MIIIYHDIAIDICAYYQLNLKRRNTLIINQQDIDI